jgi:hypothetical protein
MEQGHREPGDLENRLEFHVGQLGPNRARLKIRTAYPTF